MKSEFQHCHGRLSGLTDFTFVIAFITVATSSSVASMPKTLTTGCCWSLFGISVSSMSDFAFSSEWKNRTHLSRIHPLSRSSFLSSSRAYCVVGLFLLQFHRFDALEESMLVSYYAQPLLQRNGVVLEETNDCCTPHSL